MTGPTPRTIALTVLAFLAVTLFVQAGSHFVVNAEHYAGIDIMRAEPIMPLGILAILVQGTAAALLYPRLEWTDGSVGSGLRFTWMMGAFLASYIVFAEPAKYLAPSILDWMLTEASASFLQFTLFGLAIGPIHRSRGV